MDWRDIPSLAALRAFEAAARSGGFSAAARELNVTHAAIAQHVRALEAHFGTALMSRDGQTMLPTPAGRQLADDLTRGFGEIAAGVRALASARGEGPIALTTTPSFAENWLMPRLAGFWSAHPDIPVTISTDDRLVDLRREGFHLGVRYGRGPWPGVEAAFLTNANTVVVGHPRLAERLPADFDPNAPDAARALAALPWLVDRSYGEFLHWIAGAGLDLAAIAPTELQTNALVLAATRAGAGLSMQPRAVVEEDVSEGRLVTLLEQTGEAPGYFVVHSPGLVPARVETFIRWLKSAV